MRRLPPTSTLFPYTTLFRSDRDGALGDDDLGGVEVPSDRGGDVEHVLQIRRAVLVGRRAHGDEDRSEEHTSELQSPMYLVCRLLLEKKKKKESRHRLTRKRQ